MAKRDEASALGNVLGKQGNVRSGMGARQVGSGSIFGKNDQNQILYLEPKQIGPYSIPSDKPGGGQAFSMEVNDEYLELKKMIQENGVLEPAIVRPWKYDDTYKYEMLAGHRRRQICEELNMRLPCIIRTEDDDTAAITMSVTNTTGRKNFRPSELAWAYRIELEARRRQKKESANSENDEVCHDGTQGVRMTEEIGKRQNQSARTVSRYIRLTYLLPDILKDYVDPGILDIVTGEHISHLPKSEQKILLKLLQEGKKPNAKQAETMKELSKQGKLTEAAMNRVLDGKKIQNSKPKPIKIPSERIGSFFPKKTKPAQIEQEVYDALSLKRKFFPDMSYEEAVEKIQILMERDSSD